MTSLRSFSIDKIYQQLMGEYVLTFLHPLCIEKGYTSVPLFRGLLIFPFIFAKNISQLLTANHVSVGSGCGGMETLIFDGNNFIGVDPDPAMGCSSYEIFHPPEFKNVRRLIKKRPKIVKDCSLWLMWPNNSCPFCEKNTCLLELHHPAYDFEAIQKLKPKTITMMVSLNQRTSGSIELDNFVKKWEDSDYVLTFTCSSVDVSTYAMMLYPLITEVQFFFFIRKDLYQPFFKSHFENARLPSVFYTMDDYWKIRASISPKKLVFDAKSTEILDDAVKKAIFDPLMTNLSKLAKKSKNEQTEQPTATKRIASRRSPSAKSPSNSANTSPSSSPPSSHKEDIGLYFVFE